MAKREPLEQIDNAIKNNVDLNKLDRNGWAFIHYTAEFGSSFSITGLLDAGAKVDQADECIVTELMEVALIHNNIELL